MKNPQQMALCRTKPDEYAIAYKDDEFGVIGTKECILADISKNMEQMKC